MRLRLIDCGNDSAPLIANILFKEWLKWPGDNINACLHYFCKKYNVNITLDSEDMLTHGGYVEVTIAVFHMTDEEIFLHELAHTVE